MRIFDGYLICSDIDGTLTDSNREISKENLETIKFFQENGGKFTVSTGRFPEYLKGFFHLFKPNCPAIAGNGGLLYDYEKDKAIQNILFDCDTSDFLKFIWDEMPNVTQVGFCDYEGAIENFIKSDVQSYDDYFMKVTRLTTSDELLKSYRIHKETISRYYIIQKSENIIHHMKILLEKFSNKYDIYPSWGEGIECLPKGIDKGNMVAELKKYLGNIHTTICVGDFDNDISMFKVADISFAVENAPERVKKHANHIAPNHNENAIAFIIKNLYEELKK
ncbi:MAG: Cof-type HAD-IIB family hydrolase [Clostridia bacterium]